MTNSIRTLITSAIETRLGEITEANGYSTQVGSTRVYPYNRAPTKLPNKSIVFYASGETVTGPVNNDRYEAELNVSIGFYISATSRDPQEDGEKFLADIQTCMGGGLRTPDDPRLTISTTNYSTGDPATIYAEILEVGNSLNNSDANPSIVIGQVDYIVQYFRNMHRPDRH
jgi:hypothetical protein